MDWNRKHLCDLAWVCKKYEEDPTLSAAHRLAFGNA
jgi:hypothetical protein